MWRVELAAAAPPYEKATRGKTKTKKKKKMKKVVLAFRFANSRVFVRSSPGGLFFHLISVWSLVGYRGDVPATTETCLIDLSIYPIETHVVYFYVQCNL